jgi:hypothetical protein
MSIHDIRSFVKLDFCVRIEKNKRHKVDGRITYFYENPAAVPVASRCILIY